MHTHKKCEKKGKGKKTSCIFTTLLYICILIPIGIIVEKIEGSLLVSLNTKMRILFNFGRIQKLINFAKNEKFLMKKIFP